MEICDTPENPAAMADIMKDFVDRTHCAARDHISGRPHAIAVRAGCDRWRAVRKIVRVLPVS